MRLMEKKKNSGGANESESEREPQEEPHVPPALVTRSGEVTRLLNEYRRNGSSEAARAVIELMYAELYELARARMRGERRAHTLTPTALVNETYIKLMKDLQRAAEDAPGNRRAFMSFAARAMRNLLVDYANVRNAKKNPESKGKVDLSVDLPFQGASQVDLVAINEAFEQLEKEHPKEAQAFEMWYFVAWTQQEIADILGVNLKTVNNWIRTAKAWMKDYLGSNDDRQEPRS